MCDATIEKQPKLDEKGFTEAISSQYTKHFIDNGYDLLKVIHAIFSK